MKELSKRVVIVSLKIATWRTSLKHEQATQDCNTANDTGCATVRVVLTKASSLLALRATAQKAVRHFMDNTLPSATNGFRLLPTPALFSMSAEMKKHSACFQTALDAFVAAYPSIRVEAAQKTTGMGKLFDAAAWPPDSEIRNLFIYEFRHLPATFFGRDAQWAQWLEDSATEAVSDLKERLAGKISDLAKAFAGSGKTENIHPRTLAAFRALATEINGLNVTDSPDINKVASECAALGSLEAAALNADAKARDVAATTAAGLSSLLGGTI